MASKVWFITGTSKGFGRVWAEAALERGDLVAATARDVKSLDSLVSRYGDRVAALTLDVTDKAAVAAKVSEAHRRFGGIGFVVGGDCRSGHCKLSVARRHWSSERSKGAADCCHAAA